MLCVTWAQREFFHCPICFSCNSKSYKADLVEPEVYLHGGFKQTTLLGHDADAVQNSSVSEGVCLGTLPH